MSFPLAVLILSGVVPASRDALAAPVDEDPVAVVQADDDEDDEEKDDKDDKDDDYGGDEDDLDVFQDAGGEDAEKVERIQDGDTLEPEGEGEEKLDEDYGGDEDREEFNFEEEDDAVPIGGPGQDTARIYRDYMKKIEDLGPDEEIIQWERYLDKYPNSLFKDRIQSRIEDISEVQYDERVPGSEGFKGSLDAGKREIGLSAPLHLEPVDPRTRLRTAFEWGYPSYINLVADYEYQIQRNWSVHGGVRHRYTGWSIEGGTRYALVKSARTNTIVTGIFDVRGNTNPFYPSLRPQVGAGQRLNVGPGVLDLQLIGGTDLELRSPFSVRWIGGTNLTYHPSDRVAFFLETNVEAKHLGWDEGDSFFRFAVATFGITFSLDKEGKKFGTVGANAPYASYYWGYHFGGVMGDFKLYQ